MDIPLFKKFHHLYISFSTKIKRWQRECHEVIVKIQNAIGDKNVGILAAGIAYFATLSFFPLMVALVSISALFIQPDQLQGIVASINAYLPKDIASLVSTQLTNLIDKPNESIIASAIALVLALWGIAGAVENLANALNVCYDVKKRRSFLRAKLSSIALTLGVIVFMLVAVPMMSITEGWMVSWGVPYGLIAILSIVRWLALVGMMMLALAMLYHYGPNRPRPRWQWVSWGAVIATILWLIVTALFFVYARFFAHFSDSYSLFAGIIVLMTWFNLSAQTILIGAEINRMFESKHSSSHI